MGDKQLANVAPVGHTRRLAAILAADLRTSAFESIGITVGANRE
jgi:hypothetical protein